MRTWTLMLSGLIIWAIHFFALYAVASIFLTTQTARALTLMLTLICLAACGWALARLLRGGAPIVMDALIRSIGLCGLGLGGLAIVWQALPALFV